MSPRTGTEIGHEDALEISFVKARYCRFVDTKQWTDLRRLLARDATFHGFAAAPNGATADQFVQGVSDRLQLAVSVHRCCLPEMRLMTPDRARVIWSMTDYNEWRRPIAFPGVTGAFGYRGYGYYEEEYRRSGRTWLIAFSRLVRLRVDPILQGQLLPESSMDHWISPSADWFAAPDL